MKTALRTVVCVAWFLSVAQKASAADPQPEHYELRRNVIELSLDRAPVAALRCTVTDDANATSATVVWEATESKGLTRYALLPLHDERTTLSVACSSNVIDVRVQKDTQIYTLGYQYRFGGLCNIAKELSADDKGAAPAEIALDQVTGVATESVKTSVQLRRCYELPEERASVVLKKRYDVTPTTVLRSLDPVTPLLNDALTALTAVAVDRAATAATEFAEKELSRVFCKVLVVRYLHELSGSVGNLLANAARIRLQLREESPLLPNVCNVVKTVRIEDLAGSGEALWRALAADMVNLAIAVVEAGWLDVQKWIAAYAKQAQPIFDGKPEGEGVLREALLQYLNAAKSQLDQPGTSKILRRDVLDALQHGKVCWLSEPEPVSHFRSDDAFDAPNVQEQDTETCVSLLDGLSIGAPAAKCLPDQRLCKEAQAALADIELLGWLSVPGAGERAATNISIGSTLEGQTPEAIAAGTQKYFDALKYFTPNPLFSITGHLRTSLLNVIAGRQATTERDMQVLLLQLGRVGLAKTSGDWRCGLEMGFAIVNECLRAGECSADTLSRLIDEEIAAPARNTGPACSAAKSLAAWPQLRSLLGRAVDVLRPPPGTPPMTTAATALEVAFDILSHVLKTFPDLDERQLRLSMEMVQGLSVLSNAVVSGDPMPAASAVAATFSEAFDEHCEGQQLCRTAVTRRALHRAFAVMTALASYSAAYRPSTSDGASAEAVAKLRAEERKQAMGKLMDALGSRSELGPGWTAGLGVMVGGMAGYTRARGPGDNIQPLVNLALPLGLAVQMVPNGRWGLHGQATFYDLGQYVAVRNVQSELQPPPYTLQPNTEASTTEEIRAPEPRPGTGLVLGVTAGVLYGSSAFPLFAGVDASYAPATRYAGEKAGVFRFGVLLGAYVPIFDFASF